MIRMSLALVALLFAWRQETPPGYETREKHDPNGINKWYLGREIAHVMGPGGIPWLDRPERENEENPAKCIDMPESVMGIPTRLPRIGKHSAHCSPEPIKRRDVFSGSQGCDDKRSRRRGPLPDHSQVA